MFLIQEKQVNCLQEIADNFSNLLALAKISVSDSNADEPSSAQQLFKIVHDLICTQYFNSSLTPGLTPNLKIGGKPGLIESKLSSPQRLTSKGRQRPNDVDLEGASNDSPRFIEQIAGHPLKKISSLESFDIASLGNYNDTYCESTHSPSNTPRPSILNLKSTETVIFSHCISSPRSNRSLPIQETVVMRRVQSCHARLSNQGSLSFSKATNNPIEVKVLHEFCISIPESCHNKELNKLPTIKLLALADQIVNILVKYRDYRQEEKLSESTKLQNPAGRAVMC